MRRTIKASAKKQSKKPLREEAPKPQSTPQAEKSADQNTSKKSRLPEALGYTFKDPKLLELALVHKSFGNENRSSKRLDVRDNERLEFLGDAILDFIVSQILIEAFPQSTEGDLSKRRAGLVNERILAKIARDLGLGQFVLLGKGEEFTGGREKDSILSSTLEALVAAIYMDRGFEAVFDWTRELFESRMEELSKEFDSQDFKTRLQEVLQARYRAAPRYDVIESSGPDHDKTFVIQLSMNGKVLATAQGKSKKEAEQLAARGVFEKFGPDVTLNES